MDPEPAALGEFIEQSTQSFVRVRSPQIEELAGAVTAGGGTTRPEEDGALAISGLPIGAVGDLARDAGIALHELSAQQASLEEAFMELTRDSVEFHADAGPAPTPGAIMEGV
jgi:ABC-2 type transport system ATP-binding protein